MSSGSYHQQWPSGLLSVLFSEGPGLSWRNREAVRFSTWLVSDQACLLPEDILWCHLGGVILF